MSKSIQFELDPHRLVIEDMDIKELQNRLTKHTPFKIKIRENRSCFDFKYNHISQCGKPKKYNRTLGFETDLRECLIRALRDYDYITDILKEGDPKRLLLMYKQQVDDLKKIKKCMKHTLKSHQEEIERLQYNLDIVDSKLKKRSI